MRITDLRTGETREIREGGPLSRSVNRVAAFNEWCDLREGDRRIRREMVIRAAVRQLGREMAADLTREVLK